MKSMKNLFLISGSLLLSNVISCSLMAPCGNEISEIMLTNITDILHLRITSYADQCGDNDNDVGEWTEGSNIVVELDMKRDVTRSREENFLASVTEKPVDLYSSLRREQDWYISKSFADSSQIVITIDSKPSYLSGLTSNKITYNLPGLLVGDYGEPAIQFYSPIYNRFYFIYRIADYENKIAVCTLLDDDNTCEYSNGPTGNLFQSIDKDYVEGLKLYDDLQIIGLPVMCCLCIDTMYYQFNETSIYNKIEGLGGLGANVLDSRNGVVYVANKEYSGDTKVWVTQQYLTSLSGVSGAMDWDGAEDEADDDKNVEAGGEFEDDDPFFWGGAKGSFNGLFLFYLFVSCCCFGLRGFW